MRRGGLASRPQGVFAAPAAAAEAAAATDVVVSEAEPVEAHIRSTSVKRRPIIGRTKKEAPAPSPSPPPALPATTATKSTVVGHLPDVRPIAASRTSSFATFEELAATAAPTASKPITASVPSFKTFAELGITPSAMGLAVASDSLDCCGRGYDRKKREKRRHRRHHSDKTERYEVHVARPVAPRDPFDHMVQHVANTAASLACHRPCNKTQMEHEDAEEIRKRLARMKGMKGAAMEKKMLREEASDSSSASSSSSSSSDSESTSSSASVTPRLSSDSESSSSDSESTSSMRSTPPTLAPATTPTKSQTIDANGIDLATATLTATAPYALFSNIKRAFKQARNKADEGNMLLAFDPLAAGGMGMQSVAEKPLIELMKGVRDAENVEAYLAGAFKFVGMEETDMRRAKATEYIGLKTAKNWAKFSQVKSAGRRYVILPGHPLEGHVLVHVAGLGKGSQGIAVKSDFFKVDKSGIWRGHAMQIEYRNITNNKRRPLVVGNTLQPSGAKSWEMQSPLWYVSVVPGHKSGLRYVLLKFAPKTGSSAATAAVTDMVFVYHPNESLTLSGVALLGSELAFADHVCAMVDNAIVMSATAPDDKSADAASSAFAQIKSIIGNEEIVGLDSDYGKDCMRSLGIYIGTLIALVREHALENGIDVGDVAGKIAASASASVRVETDEGRQLSEEFRARVFELAQDLEALDLDTNALMVRANTLYEHMQSDFRAGDELFSGVELGRDAAAAASASIESLTLSTTAHALGCILHANACDQNADALWSLKFDSVTDLVGLAGFAL